MIKIHKNKTADTRTCNPTHNSKDQLLASSIQHIKDVEKGINYLINKLHQSAALHDHDKISNIDNFHADFITGFTQTNWWDKHRKINRHHLTHKDGTPTDVNLIDVLEMIVDCVMAGMGRTGSVYPLNIPPELLKQALDNTVELLKAEILVLDTDEP